MIVTNQARIDLAKARNDEITIPQITHISLGTGGMDGGSPRTASPSETALQNEVIKKTAVVVGRDGSKVTYRIVLSAGEANGNAISELGLWSSEIILVGIETFTPKNKDANTILTFSVDEVF